MTAVHSESDSMCILGQHPVSEALEVLWVKATEEEEEDLLTPVQLTVNKYLLAACSPFFHTLFFSPSLFKEQANKRFQLVQPKLDALKAMFSLLDPFEEAIPNRENVEDLIDLSNQYLVPAVHKKCIKFLLTLTKNEEDMLFKLKIADEFQMVELENHCFTELAKLRSSAPASGCQYCRGWQCECEQFSNNNDVFHLQNFISKSEANKGFYGHLSDRMKAKLLDAILVMDQKTDFGHELEDGSEG